MNNRNQARRAVTLERVVYGLAIKKAARLGGIFRNREGSPIVVVLRLPAGADHDEYEVAAAIMIVETSALASDVEVASPKFDRRGEPHTAFINAELRKRTSLLILWPADQSIPPEIALAADRIVDVDDVNPAHLAAAAKVVNGQLLDIEDARRMLAHPAKAVFAAFRSGRSVELVLRRLEACTSPESNDAGPLLEEMVGYGDAKAWGLSVAQDVREWKEGRLAWTEIDRGILLSGPPGTGKTVFAAALARTCGANLVATSVSRWQSAGYLSDTLKAMRRSFEDAVKKRPCVLFIDEFDAISDRAALSGKEHEVYWTQCVNLLLELVDGHERLEGVVIVAATNHPDKIDPALRRSGRLDRHIQISLPDVEARRSRAATYFGKHLSQEVLDTISMATTGLSGADFERVGREARRVARREGRDVVVDDVMKRLPEPTRIEGLKRRTIAMHESGHATVGVHLNVGLLKTVVVPWEARGHQPAGFAYFEIDGDQLWSREMLLDRIAMILGGRAAEEELLGTAYDGAGAAGGSDLHMASDIATLLLVQFGMAGPLSFQTLKSVEDRDRIRLVDREVAARVEDLLQEQMLRSREIVRHLRPVVETLAGMLERDAIVDGTTVVQMLQERSP